MKSTGIVRRIDNLGRITLPIELRKNLDMDCGDALEIYTEGNSVVLRKHESGCVFCGSTRKVTLYKDKAICENCRRELSL
ncbi:MAG: AbrB/MazE/SpoVT family DNA-binding domain-containing protein [Clostridia bacterium]|jgi:looped-hinge helix DNA binding domain, AbrB family|nr:AbrB/MazE/SpoVT family DNA-binding domain-containing protein [Clostridia bacterium]MBQ7491814.1 AbrB/MazE/SpoVT family DNA-binding domain-containing protein [Clostridia bacterium]MBR5389953.1 AbrB/MazE/SpoVT family DNA-binding domain-containing protein [Clostridia bacterium]